MPSKETGVWGYLKTRKKFWLLPLIVVFLFFAMLVIASLGSEGNFVYTLQ
jgi:hypothetical protein